MPKLSTEINFKFVQLYREEECLWNATIPSYKDKPMRDAALQKICGKLLTIGIQMTTKEIKNKIKNLRATYCQELSKIEKSSRSGAGSTEKYKSKLNWFEEMHSFIKNVPMKRKTTYTRQRNESAAPTAKISTAPTAKTSTSANKSQPEVPATPVPKKRKIAQVAKLVNEIRSIKDDLISTSACEHTIIPQQNEHNIFGAFVASQLKMLSTARAIMARDEINAILSRCRMEDLHYGKTTFSYQTPSHSSSDSHTTINTKSIPLRSDD